MSRRDRKPGLLRCLIRNIRRGNTAGMEKCLAKGADLDGAVKGRCSIVRPMDCAIEARRLESVQWLIQHGSRSHTLRDLVVAAAANGWIPLLEFAVKHGAEIERIDSEGGDLIELAVWPSEGVCETVEWLLAHGCRATVEALDSAVWWVLPEVVELLLKAGVDPDGLIGENRETALMRVCEAARGTARERCDIIRSLVQAGADVHARRQNGDMALHAAVSEGRAEEVFVLWKAGADLDAMGAHLTPLMEAATGESMRVARLLLALGARAWCAVDGVDAAWWAADIYPMLRLLIEHGANPFQRDELGRTLLHRAVHFDAEERVIRYLVALGVDPLDCDDDGFTAADIAMREGKYDMAELLDSIWRSSATLT